MHELKLFMLVGEMGDMTHAARRLEMSLATVSRHIRDLEAELGCQLFHRHRRGVELTEKGRVLYQTTVQMHRMLHTCLVEIASPAAGRLRRLFATGTFV